MTERLKEFKTAPTFVKSIDGRKVTGVFSVFGVLDSYRDVVEPGSLSKTIAERGGRVLHLWQHDFWTPPTAVISGLSEISRGELPEIVQAKWPEASGGATVTREYIESERANEVLALIKAGSPLEMSFGYDAIRYEFEETDEDGFIRHLKEIRLWETSDVLWGANPATSISKSRPSIPLESLLGQLDNWLVSMKAGQRNAAADLERINKIGVLAFELGATTVKLMDAEGDDEGKRAMTELATAAAAADKQTKENETAVPDAPQGDGVIVVQPVPETDAGKIAVAGEKADVIGGGQKAEPEDADTPAADAKTAVADETAVPEPESKSEPVMCTCAVCGGLKEAPAGEDGHQPDADVDKAKDADKSRAGAEGQPLTLLFSELDLLLLDI